MINVKYPKIKYVSLILCAFVILSAALCGSHTADGGYDGVRFFAFNFTDMHTSSPRQSLSESAFSRIAVWMGGGDMIAENSFRKTGNNIFAYCAAFFKSLPVAGRSPFVEACGFCDKNTVLII